MRRWLMAIVVAAMTVVGISAGGVARADRIPPNPDLPRVFGPDGYWFVAQDGGIFSYGPGALFMGSTGNIRLNSPIVGMAATPDGGGYWLVASDGGIFPFGNAGFYGSAGNLNIAAPAVAMASTPDGQGYWLLEADGNVSIFGDAAEAGLATGLIHSRAVAIASTADGTGYWVVDQTGEVVALNAPNYGAPGLSGGPVVGMARAPGGNGYWIVTQSGRVFGYGGAPSYGDASSLRLNAPIVGMAPLTIGGGYYLLGRDGGVFSYGSATFFGSTGNIRLNAPVLGMAVPGRTHTIEMLQPASGNTVAFHVGQQVQIDLRADGYDGWKVTESPDASVLVGSAPQSALDDPSLGPRSPSSWRFIFGASGPGTTHVTLTDFYPGPPATGQPVGTFTFTADVVP